MDAFRQGLYRESLGPYLWQLTQVVNLHLTPDLAGGRPLYVEPNLEAKLAGSFIEQAQVMQTAVGAPWMLRSEARARMNMPMVADADQLVVPLNVLVGGQASPRDSGSQNLGPKGRGPRTKARPPVTYETKAYQVLSAFFRKQAAAVKSRLGAKAADDWWDQERWDRELGADLLALGTTISSKAARDALDSLALDPESYDVGRTLGYLSALSLTTAKRTNAVTKGQLDDALEDDDPMEAVAGVFDEAEGGRSENLAGALLTTYAGWGTLEAGRQVGNEGMTKTWIAGPNPRPEHAAMDGETVLIGETFSNGCEWVGDGADSEYGCNCSMDINVP
jgi:hypothetical protein